MQFGRRKKIPAHTTAIFKPQIPYATKVIWMINTHNTSAVFWILLLQIEEQKEQRKIAVIPAKAKPEQQLTTIHCTLFLSP